MRRERRRGRRRICTFCVDKVDSIDYKQADRLRRFITERGKILPRRSEIVPGTSGDRGHQAGQADGIVTT